jgi:hypothetical protein
LAAASLEKHHATIKTTIIIDNVKAKIPLRKGKKKSDGKRKRNRKMKMQKQGVSRSFGEIGRMPIGRSWKPTYTDKELQNRLKPQQDPMKHGS